MECGKPKAVPVIDLTTNEDNDNCGSTLNPSRTLLELNVTPPLDMNGNEILITTDTKTMQAIVYKKQKSSDRKPTESPGRPSSLQELTKNLPVAMSSSSSLPSDLYAQQIHWAMCQQANGMQNSLLMPIQLPKEPIQFDNKYMRWLRYLRSYNGFRLFAQRYYRKAQTYSHAHIDLSALNASKTRIFIESILLKWWNSLSPNEKDQYVQIADIKKTAQTAKHETQL